MCDSKTGKAYKCLDDLLCKDLDPTVANDQSNSKFKEKWEEFSLDSTKDKVFMIKDSFNNRTTLQTATEAYDWTKVTNKLTWTGTYKIESGHMLIDATRLWKCVGNSADCIKTQPSLDKTRKIL